MRRLIPLVLAALLISCGGDSILSPVQTVDGNWAERRTVTLCRSTSRRLVPTCPDRCRSPVCSGSLSGTVVGSFVYPTLHLDISVQDFVGSAYDATMSATQAIMTGKLNGSGLINVEVDVHKK